MKILFLSYRFYPYVGGIETMSDLLCDGFYKHGHQIKVVTTTAETGTENRGYDIVRNPSKTELIKLHFWADLVFENNPSLNLSWPNALAQKPLVIALHTWIARVSGKQSLQDKLKFSWLKRAKQVIACSSAIAQVTYPQAKVIANPYNSGLFRILPHVVKSKKFVFLGRLVSDKGAILAVKALHGFLQQAKGSNATLTIIGEGPEFAHLQQETQRLNIEDKVIFEGILKGDALVNCLNEHEFILIPSVWEEPFGLVALEGMACGCIPIASNSGGLPEAVGQGGLLFKKADVDDLVSSMLRLENESGLKQKLLLQGIAHLKNHTQEQVVGEYIQLINKVGTKGK